MNEFKETQPLFTHIIFAWRPALLERSLDAILNQSYKNLEIILVDNPPAQDNPEIGKKVTEMVQAYAKKDSRIRVLSYPRFPFTLDYPTKNYDHGCKVAVEMSNGKYFMIQNDDDFLAPDYIEKMVKLFSEDPDCISAAGLPIAINNKGEETDGPRLYNYRPRHMPGHVLTLDIHNGGNMFHAPGFTVFAWKKETYLNLGGFHPSSDIRHMYGIVPFGKTAFDESTVFYWLRHEEQFNKFLNNQGWGCIWENMDFLKTWKIEERWRKFGYDLAKKLVADIRRKSYQYSASLFAINFWKGNWIACFRLSSPPTCYNFLYWRTIPGKIISYFPPWKNRTMLARRTFHLLPLTLRKIIRPSSS